MRQTTPNILDDVLALNAAAPAPPAQRNLSLTAIRRDGGTQPREGIDWDHVADMQQALADGADLPAISVIYDGTAYWLWDGFHRWHAYANIGRLEIPVVISQGTQEDAQWESFAANQAHGLKRTPSERERAIRGALKHPKASGLSNSAIGKHLGVSDKTVDKYRKEMESTSEIPKSITRIGADGRTYNTQNIGSNRPARLYVGDLKGLVAKWMGMHWQHAWPDNPSHTNGEFWRSLVAWMHENVRETWQEGDLKEAIKALHWLSRPEPQPAASAPSQQIAPATGAVGLLAVWELEKVAREVSKQVYGDKPQPFALNDMRQGARMRQGRFWLLCVQTINANNWRHADLAQAIHNVAEQMAQRANAPADDLHAGAGRTPPPPLTVAELVEELTPHLAGFVQMEIDRAGLGIENKCLAHARYVLSDFSYRTSDLNAALMLIGGRRAQAAVNREIIEQRQPTPAAVVNGERSLPEWAEPEAATRRQAIIENDRRMMAEINSRTSQPEPATVAQTVADVVAAVHGEPVTVAQPAETLPVSQRADYESDEWYTPQEYIDAAREVMGEIDLDPASSELAQTVVRANVYLTRFDDGLRQVRWIHQRIWLNPPYSNPAPWIEKLVREHQAGPYCTEAIVLVNNATETSWFQLLLENFPVCLPARRLAFWRYDHANVGARQGQAFFYLGANADKFEQVFKRFGPILRRVA